MEYIIFGLIFGLVCYYMAKNRGRDGVGGFVAGAIFGIFAMVYYLIVGDTVEMKALKAVKLKKEIDRIEKEEK